MRPLTLTLAASALLLAACAEDADDADGFSSPMVTSDVDNSKALNALNADERLQLCVDVQLKADALSGPVPRCEYRASFLADDPQACRVARDACVAELEDSPVLALRAPENRCREITEQVIPCGAPVALYLECQSSLLSRTQAELERYTCDYAADIGAGSEDEASIVEALRSVFADALEEGPCAEIKLRCPDMFKSARKETI